MNKALFLDRDGVVNDNKIKYVNHADDIKFNKGLFDFCRRAVKEKYKIIIVTNQGGIACGFLTIEDHQKIMDKIFLEFKAQACPLTAYIACPHFPPDNKIVESLHGANNKYIKHCTCRKPGAGMLIQAKYLFDIDFSKSLMIGDQPTDIAAANAVGVSSYLFNQEIGLWPTL